MVVPTGLPEASTARMNNGPTPGPGNVKTALASLVVRINQAFVSLLKISTVQNGIGTNAPLIVIPVITEFTFEKLDDLNGMEEFSVPPSEFLCGAA